MRSRHKQRIALAWGARHQCSSYTSGLRKILLLGSAQACKTEKIWSLPQKNVQWSNFGCHDCRQSTGLTPVWHCSYTVPAQCLLSHLPISLPGQLSRQRTRSACQASCPPAAFCSCNTDSTRSSSDAKNVPLLREHRPIAVNSISERDQADSSCCCWYFYHHLQRVSTPSRTQANACCLQHPSS